MSAGPGISDEQFLAVIGMEAHGTSYPNGQNRPYSGQDHGDLAKIIETLHTPSGSLQNTHRATCRVSFRVTC